MPCGQGETLTWGHEKQAPTLPSKPLLFECSMQFPGPRQGHLLARIHLLHAFIKISFCRGILSTQLVANIRGHIEEFVVRRAINECIYFVRVHATNVEVSSDKSNRPRETNQAADASGLTVETTH